MGKPDSQQRAERGGDRLADQRLTEHRPTQLPSDLAARAREVATPTADDLAAAEAEVVLVRRNYVPKDAL